MNVIKTRSLFLGSLLRFVDIYIVLCAPVMCCTGYKLLWPALSTYSAISTNNIQKVLRSYIHSFTFMRPIFSRLYFSTMLFLKHKKEPTLFILFCFWVNMEHAPLFSQWSLSHIIINC